MSDTICQVPPEGWWCSRERGHDGPCAARQIFEDCGSLWGDDADASSGFEDKEPQPSDGPSSRSVDDDLQKTRAAAQDHANRIHRHAFGQSDDGFDLRHSLERLTDYIAALEARLPADDE